MLIFISGRVGAGKSTLAKNLFNYLSDNEELSCQGLKAFPLFSYLLYAVLSMVLCGRDLVIVHNNVNIHPATLLKKRLGGIPQPLFYLLGFIEVVSVFLQYVKLRIVCTRKQRVIIEDGFINMIANYIEIFGAQAKWLILFLYPLIRSFNRCTLMRTVYLYLDSQKASIERWTSRGHPVSTAVVNCSYLIKYDELIGFSKDLYKQLGYDVFEVNTHKISSERTFSLVIQALGL